MKVLAIDCGYGHNKVVFGNETGIKKIYKFISAAAEVKVNSMVNDQRVISYNDRHFYIGDDALHVQSSSIIDINNYQLLEYFSPAFVSKCLTDLQVIPDIIVLGLSIAQIGNSAHYKKNIEDFLRKSGVSSRVAVVPQGAVAKLAIDKYGMDFPDPTKDFNTTASYVLADIGFDTLDICHVVNGKTSGNLVRGIEGKGAVVIVQHLIEDIRDTHDIRLNISEAKEVLYTGLLKRRGVVYEVASMINEVKAKYVSELRSIIEHEFGDVLDKVDNLILIGGGSYILHPGDDGFVKSPKNNAEYYNAIGYYLHGLKQ